MNNRTYKQTNRDYYFMYRKPWHDFFNIILKRAVNIFSDCCIFFLADHTSVFCSSLLDLHILILCRQAKMHFDTYFCFSFYLILRILLVVFHVEVSNFSDKLYCGLMMQLFYPAIVHIYHIHSLRLEK